MSNPNLATQGDVASAMGRALTSTESAKVDAILEKASELFRRRAGQDFTLGHSTVRMKVTGGVVPLTQRPVVSIESVTDDCAGGTSIPFDLFNSRLTVSGVRSGDFVRVSYTHGGEVPDLVRLAIAELAKKVLSIDPNAVAGKTQHGETRGPFSQQDTYATWAQGGQTMLAPDDLALADSFRLKSYSPVLQVAGHPGPFRGF